MEGDAGRGRGRGRGMVVPAGGGEERADLRRPLATPQELSAGGGGVVIPVAAVTMPQHLQQQHNTLHGSNAYNDSMATINAAQLAAAAQIKPQFDPQLLHMQQNLRHVQQPPPHIATQPQHPNSIAHIQLSPIQIQQQQQQQQQIAQALRQQQHEQEELFKLKHNIQPDNPAGNNAIAFMSPQNKQAYTDLLKRQLELESKQQQQKQQQQQQQLQQHIIQQIQKSQGTEAFELERGMQNFHLFQQIQQQQQMHQQQQQPFQQQQVQLQMQQAQKMQELQKRQDQLRQQQYEEQMQNEQQLQDQQKHLQEIQQMQQYKTLPVHTKEDILKSSSLSAAAEEFVPRFGPPSGRPDTSAVAGNNQQQQQQQQLSIPTINAPTPAMTANQPEPPQSLIQIQPELCSHPIILQVDTAVVQLSSNPSKYEAVSRQLTSVLSWHVKDEALMREIVTLIFEQGVGEANFRFTGGKLCEHLVKNVQQQYNGLSFRSILLQRCQEEFEYRLEYLKVSFYDRLIGFSYFLAEVLTRLLTPSGQPIIKLKEALCEMLTMLLQLSTNDSLKCAAQVLKMSGRYLEMGGSAEVENVMGKLRDLAMSSIPPNIQTLLMSVMEFRAASWGQSAADEASSGAGAAGKEGGGEAAKDAATAKSKEGSKEDVNGADLPVLGTTYYGPGGVIHHIEEDCVEDYPSDSDDNGMTKQVAGPQVVELDGDERLAFEQFLQSIGN